VSYDEKKRQANDIAVTVVVSGISCTCARFTEDIRNVVNDLGPDGVRVLPVLGVGGLQNLNDVLFLKNMDMAVVDEDNLRLLKKKDGVHLLPLDQESLQNHDLRDLFANYLPAEITHQNYPNLIAEGASVPTIANRALLVAYNWPENSPRYKRVAKFIDAFFGKI